MGTGELIVADGVLKWRVQWCLAEVYLVYKLSKDIHLIFIVCDTINL